MADFTLLNEDFSDFAIGEFPYDKNHSAMGEYHFINYPGCVSAMTSHTAHFLCSQAVTDSGAIIL